MSIGLFVEGKSDRDALTTLMRKILEAKKQPQGIISREVPRGDMLSATKMAAYFIPLFAQHNDMRKVIVCLDCECTDPAEIRGSMVDTERRLAAKFPSVPVRYIIVVHALEGWLASDENALRRVIGKNASLTVPPSMETICRPAEWLDDVFTKNGKKFLKTQHDPEIAKNMDYSRIAQRSPSFSEFHHAVEDP